MPPTTAIATNLPPRPPTSSIVQSVQRSPVSSPRIADPRQQQRSGSVRPSSPPQPQPRRSSTPPQPPPEEEKIEDGPPEKLPIDMDIFQQILDLDDEDGTREFSKGMVRDYFTQAEETFEKMDKAIAGKKCKELSELGHFLKGSSATLGVSKVRDTCQKIQCNGADAKLPEDVDVAVSKISTALKEARIQYEEAEDWLRKWYSEVAKAGDI